MVEHKHAGKQETFLIEKPNRASHNIFLVVIVAGT